MLDESDPFNMTTGSKKLDGDDKSDTSFNKYLNYDNRDKTALK